MDEKIDIIIEVLGDSLDKHGYMSGSSTEVPPIAYWVELGEIDALLSHGVTRKDIKEKAEKILTRCGFRDWWFVDNHGDCPNGVRFYV